MRILQLDKSRQALRIFPLEIVLASLIEAFVFSPGSKEIEWHMNDIVVPVIKGSDDIFPTLPMKVTVSRS